jgi:hypothetical protein
MTKTYLALSLLAAGALACAALQPGQRPSATRPADFRVQYEWREGSLPPPYHFELTIIIEPDGAGTIRMVPDYPHQDVPAWIEPFAVAPEAHDSLYSFMLDRRVFTRDWRAEDSPPVGGGYSWAVITADDRQVTIPAFPVREQAHDAADVLGAVRRLVPQELMDELEARRQEYVREHGG